MPQGSAGTYVVGMTEATDGPATSRESGLPVTGPEWMYDDLLAASHLLAAHQLPELLSRQGELLGVSEPIAYLADLQQQVLIAFLGSIPPVLHETVVPLAVDTTLAGRAYQHDEVLTQDLPGGRLRVWLPLLSGSDRLGVLTVVVPDPAAWHAADGLLGRRLRRFAALAAMLIAAKTLYGDVLVRLRRRSEMGLAAEMQWSLLPPLTFACREVTVAAALEPAYQVAGDSVDYAVDAGCVRIGVFDGMGHGLQSAQLAALTVAAYRNARRSYRTLTETARAIDGALLAGFGGDAFATGVLAQLDTDTGRLEWVNAGHPEPLLLRNGRLVKTLHADPAPPLGLGHLRDEDQTGTAYVVGAEQLEPGDRVLLYSDGVTEARSPDGEFFGVEQLVELLTRNLASGLPTPETMRRVVRTLLTHQQGQLSDDATLLLLEWRSGNEQALLP